MDMLGKIAVTISVIISLQLITALFGCHELYILDSVPKTIHHNIRGPGYPAGKYNVCWTITSDYFILINLRAYIGSLDALGLFEGQDTTIPRILASNMGNTDVKELFYKYVKIEFHSDAMGEPGRSFNVLYVGRNSSNSFSDCGTSVYASTSVQYYTSTNFPVAYPHSQECILTINSAVGTVITVTLHFMDLEISSSCNKEYLRVSDSFGNNTVNMCGTSWTDVMSKTSVENVLEILFVSGGVYTNSGFSFSITASALPHGSFPCSNHNTCVENATCTSGTCLCDSAYYNDTAGMCNQRALAGGNCDAIKLCADKNSKCINGKCTCESTYYNFNGKCELKKSIGESCVTSDMCNDPNTICTYNRCTCGPDYYDDNGESTSGGNCLPKIENGDKCTTIKLCKETNSLCKDNVCTCEEDGYYDSNGQNIGGKCVQKVELHKQCDDIILCKSKYAECLSGTCICSEDNYHEVDGECVADKFSYPQKIGIVVGVVAFPVTMTALPLICLARMGYLTCGKRRRSRSRSRRRRRKGRSRVAEQNIHSVSTIYV